MPTEAVVALAGLAASFLSGLLGIGGGIVLTPLLLYLPGLLGATAIPVKLITGLTVVQAISASVIGSWRHHGYGNVSRRVVLLMGPPAAIASLVGAVVSKSASDVLLLVIFAAFSFIAAFLLLLPAPALDVPTKDVSVRRALAVAIAVVIGFFGGMVGIGAIANILTALVYILRVPPRVAIGTSLGIGFFGAFAAFVGKAATSQVEPLLAAIVVASAFVASPIGAWVSVRTPTPRLLRVLAVVVTIAGIRILITAFAESV
jgi:uncharacterized membrane protein YfcA